MTKRILIIINWIAKRTQKEKIYLFILGCVLIYALFYSLFIKPIQKRKLDLHQQIIALIKQKHELQQQLTNLEATVNQPDFVKLLAKKNNLLKKLAEVQQHLAGLQPTIFGPKALQIFREKMITQHGNTQAFHLKTAPETEWALQPVVKEAGLIEGGKQIYELPLTIDFENDYLQTIHYIQQLESITPGIYWDSLHYKVLTYPNAQVTIKFHVLSLQKS